MDFQDELRRNMKKARENYQTGNEIINAEIRNEADYLMNTIREGLLASAMNADNKKTTGQPVISYIYPISQRFIRKQRMDNGNQIAANSKRGLFRDRSLVYRVWYSFQVDPKKEEEFITLRQALNGLAAKDGIRLDFILYDQRTNKEYPFPTQIDGFQFERDFILAVRASIRITDEQLKYGKEHI